MIFKKNKISWLVVFSILVLFLSSVFPLSTAASSHHDPSPLSSPKSYINYLKNYSIEDAYESGITDNTIAKEAVANASNVLKDYKKLSKKNQEKFLHILSDPTTVQAMYSGNLEQLDEATKQDVAWTKVQTDEASEDGLISVAALSRTVSGTGTLWVLGVRVTEYKIVGTYEYNSYGVTRAVRTQAYVTRNWNPTVVTDLTNKDHDVRNGKYYGDAVFYYKMGLGSVGIIQLGNVFIGIVGNKNGKESGYFYTR
ncbi:hypothetical protein CU633_12330 [Bacillus sp. V3-13]|uniref:hypothetical protein n=1 Tax=Bacillus sp. V3-13 TaxID=2053728 RepID=UPI000C75BA6B|nr:hypothetical protein [Bacillus sp. V3-13]PLR77004.1 hypothetical protein CU633_12330 [Bacillus sp. V3-13]